MKAERTRQQYRPAVVGMIVWLCAALACNMPVAPTAAQQGPQGIDATLASAQETVDAKSLPTPGQGVATATGAPLNPTLEEQPGVPTSSTPTLNPDDTAYFTQPGDTIQGLAGRFGVPVEQVAVPGGYDAMTLLPEGLQVILPHLSDPLPYRGSLLPDSEIAYSPADQGFSVEEYVSQAGGYLSTYREDVDGKSLTGAQIIERVAQETSINPRMLLAVLEYRAHWVLGQPEDLNQVTYPIGFYASEMSGLHKEITLVARQLTIAYYGWRSGQVIELEFANGSRTRLDPTLNAGSVAVQYLFSKLVGPDLLANTLYGENNFLDHYRQWFGDPQQRAQAVGPMLPYGLQQPVLELPFAVGTRINFTGGPHLAWGIGSPLGGIDFTPADVEKGCTVSHYWVTAGAPGLVVRSQNGQVVLDLDMDGREETGWAVLYLHVAELERVAVGTKVKTDDPLGHPSCEGGVATGTHVHIARKYNGEWLGANDTIPFVLSGWQAFPGSKPYRGWLLKGDTIIPSRVENSSGSIFTR